MSGNFGEIKSAAGTQNKETYVDALINTLPPIYEKEDSNTFLNRLYSALAEELVKTDIILEQTQNNNYISVTVSDELIVRSSSNLDRLKSEGAYQLDKIRINSSSTMSQNTKLIEGINMVQLYFIPENTIGIYIASAQDVTQASVNFPISFDSLTNILSIISDRSGNFVINYKDTGDVIRLSKNIIVPIGLFLLGFDEGGFGDLGWSE